MKLYNKFSDISIDEDRNNAKETYERELHYNGSEYPTTLDKADLQHDIVRGYLQSPLMETSE